MMLLIHVQIRHQRNLYQQNGRNTVFEFLVHRLMVPDFHSHPCPDASSKDSQQQKRGFRNAPFGFLCLVLINAVHDECNCIDAQEIVGEATV